MIPNLMIIEVRKKGSINDNNAALNMSRLHDATTRLRILGHRYTTDELSGKSPNKRVLHHGSYVTMSGKSPNTAAKLTQFEAKAGLGFWHPNTVKRLQIIKSASRRWTVYSRNNCFCAAVTLRGETNSRVLAGYSFIEGEQRAV